MLLNNKYDANILDKIISTKDSKNKNKWKMKIQVHK